MFLGCWANCRDVLDHIDPKFCVQSFDHGPGAHKGFLIANLRTLNALGTVNSVAWAVERDLLDCANLKFCVESFGHGSGDHRGFL